MLKINQCLHVPSYQMNVNMCQWNSGKEENWKIYMGFRDLWSDTKRQKKNVQQRTRERNPVRVLRVNQQPLILWKMLAWTNEKVQWCLANSDFWTSTPRFIRKNAKSYTGGQMQSGKQGERAVSLQMTLSLSLFFSSFVFYNSIHTIIYITYFNHILLHRFLFSLALQALFYPMCMSFSFWPTSFHCDCWAEHGGGGSFYLSKSSWPLTTLLRNMVLLIPETNNYP